MDHCVAGYLPPTVLTKPGPAISLRPSGAEDEAFLFYLYLAGDGAQLAAVLLPAEQKEHLLRLQYTAQAAAYAARFPGSGYQLVLSGGRPVGRLWTVLLPEEIRIVDMAILPDARGMGVGSYLFRELMEMAARAGKPLRSTVFRFNEGSLRLHARLGFQIVGEDEMQFHLEWRRPGDHGA